MTAPRRRPRVVEAAHAALCEGLDGVDALGFHGQTLAHDPENRRTHQAGDGARLARPRGAGDLGFPQSTDVEMGGQGAPLAPFYHWACARHVGAEGPVAFLNLGGVGNITWTDPQKPAPEAYGACLAFDTGPANAPLDDLMHARGLGAYDHEGALALSGRVARDVVRAAMGGRFFARMPPKSLDRNDFAGLLDVVSDLSDTDALATLAAVSVAAVQRGMVHLPSPPERVLVTGGGRRNEALDGGPARGAAVPGGPGGGGRSRRGSSGGAGLRLPRGAGVAGACPPARRARRGWPRLWAAGGNPGLRGRVLGPWNIEAFRGQREAVELKTRGYGAGDERKVPGAARRLPVMFRHDDLRGALRQVRGQEVIPRGASLSLRE
jgi:hypothetical protein